MRALIPSPARLLVGALTPRPLRLNIDFGVLVVFFRRRAQELNRHEHEEEARAANADIQALEVEVVQAVVVCGGRVYQGHLRAPNRHTLLNVRSTAVGMVWYGCKEEKSQRGPHTHRVLASVDATPHIRYLSAGKRSNPFI